MSGFGSRPTAAPVPVDANRRALAEALLGFPARVGQAFTGMANAGLQANEAFLQGRGTDGEDILARPFLPSTDTGGRLGALASFVGSNMAMGGPAGSLGAGPSMARAANALPMDEASRMARAADMGFTIDAYHGANADIRAFDMGRAGANTDSGFYGRGAYFARNPDLAAEYGDAIYPVKLKVENPLVLQTMDEKQKFDDMFRGPFDQYGRSDFNSAAATDWLKKQGHDGVIVYGKDGVSEYMVPDARQIRSRFAAFDPARQNEADLLASFAPNPLAGALLGYQPQE